MKVNFVIVIVSLYDVLVCSNVSSKLSFFTLFYFVVVSFIALTDDNFPNERTTIEFGVTDQLEFLYFPYQCKTETWLPYSQLQATHFVLHFLTQKSTGA